MGGGGWGAKVKGFEKEREGKKGGGELFLSLKEAFARRTNSGS